VSRQNTNTKELPSPDAPGRLLEVGPSGLRPRRPRRPLLLTFQVAALALVAALLALLVWRVVASQRGTSFVSDIGAGKAPAAPAFRLDVIWRDSRYWPASLRPALADGKLSLDELRGYPIVLNFWASWCIPCKDEARALAAAAQHHRGRVLFLGVDVQDFTSDARSFLRRNRVPYVSVRDGSGSAYENYGLTGVPETYYLDARGRAIAHAPGQVSREDVETGIAGAVAGSR
jgi:cytochrome c biogenesis protein CcmG/thiol:disulfide interchange protein DsbE